MKRAIELFAHKNNNYSNQMVCGYTNLHTTETAETLTISFTHYGIEHMIN